MRQKLLCSWQVPLNRTCANAWMTNVLATVISFYYQGLLLLLPLLMLLFCLLIFLYSLYYLLCVGTKISTQLNHWSVYDWKLISFSALNHLILPLFAKGLWGMPQCSRSLCSALAFTFCLHRTSRSTSSERLGPLQRSFPGMHISYPCTGGSRFPEICLGFLNLISWIFF